jgi:tetratricopeptide (TPR) repeat protein
MRTHYCSIESGARDRSDQREPSPIPRASSVAPAANNLAWIYAGLSGGLGTALALAHLAAARAPKPADADHRLGWLYYRTGLPSLAIDAFTRSVEKDPTNPIYFRHLGLAYAKAGDWASSKECLEKAAELRPGSRPRFRLDCVDFGG